MLSFKQFLVELYNVKRFYGAKSLKNIFKSLKWKPIGKGAFGSVWQPPNANYVIKAWTKDEPYEEFLKYVTKPENVNNPHLPRVLGRLKSIPCVHARSQKNENVKLVKLEKLEPLTDTMGEFITYILNSYPSYNVKVDGNVFPQAKTFIATLRDLENNRTIGAEDIHAGNVMERVSDGSYVIIDPWGDLLGIEDLETKQCEDEMNPKYFKPHHLIPNDDDEEMEAA